MNLQHRTLSLASVQTPPLAPMPDQATSNHPEKDGLPRMLTPLSHRCKHRRLHQCQIRPHQTVPRKTAFPGCLRGILPSGLFGANAAWWAIMVLAHNLRIPTQSGH
jgi:hypothetical protein